MNPVPLKIFDAYRSVLADAGLDSFDALFNLTGGRNIDGHRDRNVVRIELSGPDGAPVAFYLKREWNPKAAMLVRRWLERGFRAPPSRSRLECKHLVALGRRGVATAEPVAVGEERSGLGYRRALLMVREVPGAVSLGEYLHTLPEAPSPEALRAKRAMTREIAAMVRKMHDGGMVFRDLFAKHIFVDPARSDGSFRPTLIDAQRACRFPHLLPHARWHDLASLAVTVSAPACTMTDRLRFLLAYVRQSRLTPAVKLMLAKVAKRAGTLEGKGGDPNLSKRHDEMPPGTTALGQEHFHYIDQRRLFVDIRYLPELGRLGLDTFDGVMATTGGERYRDVPDRLTVRIPLEGLDGQPDAVYLKRHQKVDRRQWLTGLLRWRKPRTRANAECRNIALLAHFGIPTMRPVAIGEDERWAIRQRSFLMTEEIAGGVPADDYLKAHFPADCGDARAVQRKRRLIRDIARLARRFHRSGFHHRDFYLCHVFVRELADDAEPWALHLIDLQRVRWPGAGKVGRRWLVKDLAQMNYSAPPGVVTRSDKLRFLREYLALPARRKGGRLGREARALIRSIVAKTGRIARHDARLRARTARA